MKHSQSILFIFIFFLLLFCGCSATLPHKSANENNDLLVYQTENPDPNDSSMTDENTVQSVEDETSDNTVEELLNLGTSSNLSSLDESGKMQDILNEALNYCQASQDFWHNGDPKAAFDTLDQAYSLILQIDTQISPELIQQKEDIRFMISKRILEIHASRNLTTNGEHQAIPIIINHQVEKEINLLTKRNRPFFIEAYKLSGRYRPYIVEELKKAGLPEELSWLPLIESGYKVTALSKSRALGLWQFIPSTGYKFGLNRDKYIDERLDPVKSTASAIAYLKELHKIFGDWATVLAAYNCGEENVLRIIREQNVNYLDNFWDLYKKLPRETARYVPRFIATLHVVNNLEKYNFDRVHPYKPIPQETVSISKSAYLRDIAKTIATSEKVLKKLNPELRYGILPGSKYALNVPEGKGELLLANLDKVTVSSLPQKSFVYHKVRPGETLTSIAKRYSSTVKRIARFNNINKRSHIVAGKRLKIPYRYHALKSKKTRRAIRFNGGSTHTVRKGDSLWLIAKGYGTTTKKIRQLNNLGTSYLQIGQVLKIPQKQAIKKTNKSV